MHVNAGLDQLVKINFNEYKTNSWRFYLPGKTKT
jgi:hypothetical protein